MSRFVEHHDTVVIGGGQAGLAMSYLLTKQGRDHIVLEQQQQIGATWRQRWDSFTLVTPNWQLQLPGFAYQGDDPDGFLHRDEVVAYLAAYAASFGPPLRFGVEVSAITPDEKGNGYRIDTSVQDYVARNVVVAAGTFQTPNVPTFSRDVPADITQLTTSSYQNPAELPDGAVLVVGSGQSGCQIAQELQASGRQVYLCTSAVRRLPRRYRGKDGMWWALQLGMVDQTVDELESPQERFAPNPQISGKDGGREINLHQFARDGMVLLGHLEDISGHQATLAPNLHQNLTFADQAAEKFRQGVDMFIEKNGLDAPHERGSEPQDGFAQPEQTQLDLAQAGITTIIWATGFRWDYSWIPLAIFDGFGYPIQQRGVSDYPGLYFVGLHFLHTLKSGLFLGVGQDAEHIAAHIAGRSGTAEQARAVGGK